MERAEPVPAPGERRFYEFGEFRVDPVRRRLLRDGEPIAVTSKSFSLLVVLLERRGQVVEKEELFRRVWPDTYVTEANLTQNVSSLRKALGERAGDRRYIMTVPGCGYSFIAEVKEVCADYSGVFPLLRLEEPRPVLAFPATAAPADPEGSEDPSSSLDEIPPEPAMPPPQKNRRRGISLLSGALLLAVAALSLSLWRPGTSSPQDEPPQEAAPAATHRPAVAVLGFKDLGRNPETAWLGVALSEMLSTELAAGGQARLISGDNLTRTRQSISIPETNSLREPDLERLRTILGADLVVAGSYLVLDQQGSRQIRLDLRALQLPDGAEMATLSEVGPESDLFEIVSRVGGRLRQTLGLDKLSPGQVQAVQALHPSVPEAARLAAEGLERLRAFDSIKARELLERAAEIEPGSATIHSNLARVWYELGDDAEALREAHLALDLSRSLPREDRLAIEARLYASSRQWAQSAEIYRSLWTFYPDDIDLGLQLATALINAGRSGEALEVLGDLRKLPLGPEDPRIDVEEAKAARRIGDIARQESAAEAGAAKARRSGERLALARALIFQGDALLTNGHPGEAAPLFREAKEIANAVGHPWTTGMALSNLAGAVQALGQLDEAEGYNKQSLAIARQLGSSAGIAAQLHSLAQVYSEQGKLAEALSLLKEAHRVYVEIGDRLMQGRVLSSMAPLLLSQGDAETARRSAEEAVAAAREVGNRSDEARALEVLATVLARQGDLGGARRQLDAALRLLLRARQPAVATVVLSSSADVLARLGDLTWAQQRLDQAVALERRAGNKAVSSRLLGRRARLALRKGDVVQARELSEALLQMARQMRSRPAEAWALYELGCAQRAAGDLPAARASFQASLRTSIETGDASRSALARLELARLLTAEKPGEAADMARAVAAWSASHGSPGLEAQALAASTDALLQEGRLSEAVSACERIREIVRAPQDRELALVTTASLARCDAAAGNVEGAVFDLREGIAQAEENGLVAAALEGRRALGEIEARQR
jgi:DNA-binding winged helix-turn-helix (wHTH) protein/tetratricopeptide (TPR) repeat protein/TolB-like protein